jgi:hypothetical protein
VIVGVAWPGLPGLEILRGNRVSVSSCNDGDPDRLERQGYARWGVEGVTHGAELDPKLRAP